jgi:hypothetical protein
MRYIEVARTLIGAAALCAAAGQVHAETGTLAVRLSWGHQAPNATSQRIAISGAGLSVRSVTPQGFEGGDRLEGQIVRATAGGGDADALEVVVEYSDQPPVATQNVHVLWADLVAASDAETARRLLRDPAFHAPAPALTVHLDEAGTRGFTVTIPQLLAEKAVWIPSLDVYVTAGETPVPFVDHLRSLATRKGQRILDRLRVEPEATLAQYTSRWEDMGHPSYSNPQPRGPGHIVGLTWDSAIHKFGIDRGAGVWSDEGNPDKVRFWFAFGEMGKGITSTWKSQRLTDGLPVMVTTFEEDGVRYEVEQFAYPLHGPPSERRGDMPMVLIQQLTVTELRGRARTVPVSMVHRRELPAYFDGTYVSERRGDTVLFRARGRGQVLLGLEGAGEEAPWSGTSDYQTRQKRLDATVFVTLPAKGTRRLVVKLPSPAVRDEDVAALAAIDYGKAREATLAFWSDLVARGAQFRVPEPTVNQLFRASLWHALRLPRRHGGAGPDVRIDLPYSNFAYSQVGTPWPVNQAVYVDYMLYDLRGYHAISSEELRAQYRNNQEADGHVSGYANWHVYTPAMLYSVAQHYLLSQDRASFESLLPQSLAALDWCVAQVARSARDEGPARGLARGPLNDLTGEGIWAFNQAYLFAGLDLFGRALERHGHPRATEARDAARSLRVAIERGFGAASARSPLVQLRDGTWVPYVPAEALTPRRLLDQWYATDVDTGAVHLLRLKALPATGVMADALLHDHEDNLFYKGWGIANEPVYNQHATAYLLRDEPEAVVRTFYSYIASAFSHGALEPVEHRWTHGQYFGPPSTDGAWFELYRNMLVRERDDDALVIAQATPRAWLRDGQKIEIENAPTYYGRVSAVIESQAASGEIRADVRLPSSSRPETLLVRFRHPEAKRMRSVTVNGRPWSNFEPEADWVRVPSPDAQRYEIVVRY